jgi:hypothetical protein
VNAKTMNDASAKPRHGGGVPENTESSGVIRGRQCRRWKGVRVCAAGKRGQSTCAEGECRRKAGTLTADLAFGEQRECITRQLRWQVQYGPKRIRGYSPRPPRCYFDRETKKPRCKWEKLVGNSPCQPGTCRAAYRQVRPETLDDYTRIQAGREVEKGRFWGKAAVLVAGRRPICSKKTEPP